jgi:hypothetical protein
MNPDINGEPWQHWLGMAAAIPIFILVVCLIVSQIQPGSPLGLL